jgi:mannose-6-phosphate isomerase-like protein (cupin superfamily)
VKRVVVGLDTQGRSAVLSSQELDATQAQAVFEYRPCDLEAQVGGWLRSFGEDEVLQYIEPPVGTMRWFFAPIPPVDSGAELPPGMEGDGWHATRTVDFNFVMQGEIVMVLETEELRLQQGDFLIVQGGRHQWRNDWPGTAVMVSMSHRPEL